METTFTCYTKKVQGQVFYFVKKFTIFPEYPELPPIQEAFGMHTQFDKACDIVRLYDVAIKSQLLSEIETGVKQARIIDLNEVNLNNPRPAVGM